MPYKRASIFESAKSNHYFHFICDQQKHLSGMSDKGLILKNRLKNLDKNMKKCIFAKVSS